MPNQRKKGKRQVALWLTESELRALNLLSKKSGKNKTEFLKEKINAYLESLENQEEQKK